MSVVEPQMAPPDSLPVENGPVDSITDALAKVAIQPDDPSSESARDIDRQKNDPKSRPLVIYTRPQLLYLHKSPLVKLPAGMPALKDWFGAESESANAKKDTDTQPSPNNARDRRFRRDADEGETPSRPSFRGTTITQPSQMGNFKHQSIRAADRDRDKEADREQERDTRVKEGQERLRNLSDKYDRDRRALSSGVAQLRGKDRDTAPHLAAGTSSRIISQGQAAAVRQADARDQSKRKDGEISEDWRRGSEPARTGRGERSDNLRRDREDRERPRSGVRDSSRPRRDGSVSRRDRDRGEDRERERDRDRRDDSGRDGHSYRRDRDDPVSRDRDIDKDSEVDDPRRWRDDGKRDERMAARRDREHRDRDRDRDLRDRPRDRAPQAPSWEGSDRQERRWTPAEERDGRNKRNTGRDRRGAGGDDTKDDRREREREKEPAWMDTYIPSDSSGGFLSAPRAGGDLDGIQAFKKELKEKEQKEQTTAGNDSERLEEPKVKDAVMRGQEAASGSPLDEIQLFKLMMKREEEKKRADPPLVGAVATSLQATGQISPESVSEFREANSPKDRPVLSNPPPSSSPAPRSIHDQAPRLTPRASSSLHAPPSPSRQLDLPTQSLSDGTQALLSILSSSSSPGLNGPNTSRPADSDTSFEKLKPSGSRFFPNPIASDLPAPQASMKPSMEAIVASSQTSTQNNPPAGSRLLAFASRAPHITDNSQIIAPGPTSVQMHPSIQHKNGVLASSLGGVQNGGITMFTHGDNPVASSSSISDNLRSPRNFSPLDEVRDRAAIAASSEAFRRGSAALSGERNSFLMEQAASNDTGLHGGIPNNNPGTAYDAGGSGVATAKGSRFAKFFDGKGRDTPAANKGPGGGLGPSLGHPGSRQELGNFTGMSGNNPDTRAMEDIFAMLSNSAHGQRLGSAAETPGVDVGHFNPASNSLQALQNAQLHHPHHHHHQLVQGNGRLDALYESRLDDRNFVPDGMVPGLRSAPPPRSRQNSAMFTDGSDEMQFNGPRVQSQMYSGPVPSMYPQQAGLGRNGGVPPQPPHFRGGPSPSSLQGPPQRLPPGLANLGGRPPHEPAQFISPPIGIPSSGLHGLPHGNGASQQQSFNNYAQGNIGFGGGPQMRMPHPGAHQLQNVLGHNALQGPGHYGNLTPAQVQLLGMNGGAGVPGGLRGPGGGYTQQGPQMQLPVHAMRQQQLPPHLASLHYQQQGLPGANTQPAHDLMALLMNGGRRE
ncbi:hypothetical protein BV22DRAFT_1095867 [Leucogyrophana mollusca]|uniref:Uncharacterized protein n=1 Tax=Leucogyrophana mollusca TaxID=85980 RepID=A0ACB8B7W5_9AGAM|nr:hypothetical protein BV22DRAFT_1095867 [Leucogyrophana mollusca]